MNCERVRELSDAAEPERVPPEVHLHLAHCGRCAEYARKWRLISRGLRLLAEDPAPEPSLGFAARTMRQLEGAADAAADFWERVGKRSVYATLVMAIFAILLLVLPSSGPLRSSSTSDVYLAEPEVMTAANDPIFNTDSGATAVQPDTEGAKSGNQK
jgi:hypothetical protein